MQHSEGAFLATKLKCPEINGYFSHLLLALGYENNLINDQEIKILCFVREHELVKASEIADVLTLLDPKAATTDSFRDSMASDSFFFSFVPQRKFFGNVQQLERWLRARLDAQRSSSNPNESYLAETLWAHAKVKAELGSLELSLAESAIRDAVLARLPSDDSLLPSEDSLSSEEDMPLLDENLSSSDRDRSLLDGDPLRSRLALNYLWEMFRAYRNGGKVHEAIALGRISICVSRAFSKHDGTDLRDLSSYFPVNDVVNGLYETFYAAQAKTAFDEVMLLVFPEWNLADRAFNDTSDVAPLYLDYWASAIYEGATNPSECFDPFSMRRFCCMIYNYLTLAESVLDPIKSCWSARVRDINQTLGIWGDRDKALQSQSDDVIAILEESQQVLRQLDLNEETISELLECGYQSASEIDMKASAAMSSALLPDALRPNFKGLPLGLLLGSDTGIVAGCVIDPHCALWLAVDENPRRSVLFWTRLNARGVYYVDVSPRLKMRREHSRDVGDFRASTQASKPLQHNTKLR